MLGRHVPIVPPAAGPTWDPTQASKTLLAWYRADLGIALSGSDVVTWNDQSGAGDALRNQTGMLGALPTYSASDAAYGNQPVVLGNNAQYMTSGGAWSVAPSAPATIVIVGETAASTAFLADTGSITMMYADGSGHESAYNSTGGARTGSASVTSPCVYMLTDDGSGGGAAAKMYVTNLSTPADTFGTILTGLTQLDLLRDFNGTFPKLQGKLAEVIVWGGVLTGTDVSNLRTYLNVTRAYGLGVT